MTSKWIPTTNLAMLRRMGKLGEELSECGAVASRCIIQGIDEIDPASGKTNRERLTEEVADVYAQLDCTVDMLGLDRFAIITRRERKTGYMRDWEAMFQPGDHQEDVPEGTFYWNGRTYWSDPTGRSETLMWEDGMFRRMTDDEHSALNNRNRKVPL